MMANIVLCGCCGRNMESTVGVMCCQIDGDEHERLQRELDAAANKHDTFLSGIHHYKVTIC